MVHPRRSRLHLIEGHLDVLVSEICSIKVLLCNVAILVETSSIHLNLSSMWLLRALFSGQNKQTVKGQFFVSNRIVNPLSNSKHSLFLQVLDIVDVLTGREERLEEKEFHMPIFRWAYFIFQLFYLFKYYFTNFLLICLSGVTPWSQYATIYSVFVLNRLVKWKGFVCAKVRFWWPSWHAPFPISVDPFLTWRRNGTIIVGS